MANRNSKQTAKERNAIDVAKSFWGNVEIEPHVSGDFVLLREIVHALDILTDQTPEQLKSDWDAKSSTLVYEAIASGALLVQSFETGKIIPYSSWPTLNDFDEKSEIPESEFGALLGVIWLDHLCRGIVGQLPVIKRAHAEKWLSHNRQPLLPYRPRKKEEALEAYDHLFPDGHKAEGNNSWNVVALLVSAELVRRRSRFDSVGKKTIMDGLEERKKSNK